MNKEKVMGIVDTVGAIGMLLLGGYYAFYKNDYPQANFCLILALGIRNSK